ncbi:GDSL-type esterase/lipase family protein [Ruminococcus flavefaciens]|uniref:GDSL-type esterase/lipase family protein n=1 Tax=Ruminococcus flavefaciens TaxID=1265 RepID=UPI0026EAC7BD|nr:GDSL-type esterase/lipase family protein [Ruminococcus flavefaciens]
MNKFKQCVYTVILLLTCLVASPLIYKQIWKDSVTIAPKTSAKEPVSATEPSAEPTSAPAQETASEAQPTSEGATTAPAEDKPAETTSSAVNFVASGPEYFDDALFIGDSRTEGIRDYGTLKNADYFCQRGLSAYQIDTSYVNGETVWDFLKKKPYAKIYLMLGINEVGNDIEYTASAYRKAVDEIHSVQPNAIIYLQGNLHVASFAETSSISNERINALNSKIQALADNKSIFYIEVNSIFDDGSGALTAEYTSDGIHVLAKYYAEWCDWLCQNTVSPAGTSSAETTTESVTYTSEPAVTTKPQNEEFSNQ